MKNIIAVCTLVFSAIGLFCLLIVFLRTKKCPPDKILVVYGNVGKDKSGNRRTVRCVHGGAAFIWPFVQNYFYLDLTPISFSLKIDGPIEIDAVFTVAVSTVEETAERAANCLMGLGQTEIQHIAENILLGQLRLVSENFRGERDEFLQIASEYAEEKLKKTGLRLINANITKFIKI